MFAVTPYIEFWSKSNKRLEIDFATQIEIDSSWKNLTDIATLEIAKKVFIRGGRKLQDYVKPGDRVTIHLGYDGKTTPEFEGFVARLDASVPLKFHCEDNMYLLKKGSISKGYGKTNLKTVIDDLLFYYNAQYPGYGFDSDVLDTDLGAFRYHNLTGAQVLAKIRETYGLIAYFRNTQLHVGFAYTSTRPRRTVKHEFYKNIIDSGLEYRSAEDTKIKVKAISNKSDNSKITVELGDPDGDVRTLNFYNLDKPGLEKAAQAEMKRLKFDGYKGSIKTFGIPVCEHGDVSDVYDSDYPDRAGKYQIDRVKTSCGIKGFKRINELGPKVA